MDQVVTVTVTGVNDAASITGTSKGTVSEDGTLTASADLTAADVDGTADAFQAVKEGTAASKGYGTYGVTAAGVWTYTLDNTLQVVQDLNAGDTLSDSFTVYSEDGTTQVIDITINGVDEPAPILGNFDIGSGANEPLDMSGGTLSVEFYGGTGPTPAVDPDKNVIGSFDAGVGGDILDFSNFNLWLTGGIEEGDGSSPLTAVEFAGSIDPFELDDNYNFDNYLNGKIAILNGGTDWDAINSPDAIAAAISNNDPLHFTTSAPHQGFVISGLTSFDWTLLWYVSDTSGDGLIDGSEVSFVAFLGLASGDNITSFDASNFLFA